MSASPPRPSYRVEHWVGRRVVADLGALDGVVQHHTTLTPFASALRLSGVTEGQVVMLEAVSRRVVTRRAITSSRRRAA